MTHRRYVTKTRLDTSWYGPDDPYARTVTLGQIPLGLFEHDEEVSVTVESGTTDRAATLDAIAGELDRQVWSPDTLNRIADHLRRAGLDVREPKEEEEPDGNRC